MQKLLQWYHMSVMTFPIAINSTVFQQLVQSNNKESIKVLYFWPFLKWICWWLYKEPLMQKAFPCHDIIMLTHWGRVTQICVGKLTNIGSDNSLSPGRRQAIIRTNAGILLIGPLGTNFSEFLIVIHTFSFNKMHLKMLSAKWRPFCLGLNVLNCPMRTKFPSKSNEHFNDSESWEIMTENKADSPESHLKSGDPFHKQLMRLQTKVSKSSYWLYLKSNDKIMSQFCTCHDSLAVMTCANLWPDWIIIIIIETRIISTRLWTYKDLWGGPKIWHNLTSFI